MKHRYVIISLGMNNVQWDNHLIPSPPCYRHIPQKEISQPRQHLRSSTLISYNDSSVTDSFILHLKATILIGRAAKFSSRLKVRFDRPADNHELRYFRALPEFAEIEASILTFQANIPGGLKQFMSDPPGGGEKPHNPYSDIIDHNMYLAYIVSYMYVSQLRSCLR